MVLAMTFENLGLGFGYAERSDLRKRSDMQNAASGCRGRRQFEVGRPASFAGIGRIRFGGSVAWPHSQRTLRSPEAIFG